MPPATKEELAKGRTLLRAKEDALKKEWCQLEGHRWDLPGVSPFNHDILECEVICNRCNAHAIVKVFIQPEPGEIKPEPKVESKKP
jgi:hypothetical protein